MSDEQVETWRHEITRQTLWIRNLTIGFLVAILLIGSISLGVVLNTSQQIADCTNPRGACAKRGAVNLVNAINLLSAREACVVEENRMTLPYTEAQKAELAQICASLLQTDALDMLRRAVGITTTTTTR